jgi:hypothetical protein
MWVWQFTADAEPNALSAKLRDHGLGIILKSHDGVTWMSEYDKSPYAVSGPAQWGVLANYFENAGVPFHAWCVVHGTDPMREAKMASDILSAARAATSTSSLARLRARHRAPRCSAPSCDACADGENYPLPRPAALDDPAGAHEGARRDLRRDCAAILLEDLQHAGELHPFC